jgi:hypothetical protein
MLSEYTSYNYQALKGLPLSRDHSPFNWFSSLMCPFTLFGHEHNGSGTLLKHMTQGESKETIAMPSSNRRRSTWAVIPCHHKYINYSPSNSSYNLLEMYILPWYLPSTQMIPTKMYQIPINVSRHLYRIWPRLAHKSLQSSGQTMAPAAEYLQVVGIEIEQPHLDLKWVLFLYCILSPLTWT